MPNVVCTDYRTRYDPSTRRACSALCMGMQAIGGSTVILLAGQTVLLLHTD